MAGNMTRKKMVSIYKEKYESVPECANTRMEKLKEELKLSDKNLANIDAQRNYINSIKEDKIEFTIYEIPLATGRPRGNFITKIFYVGNSKGNKEFMMKKLNELRLNNILIITDTRLKVNYYLPIPKGIGKEDKILAEEGLIRPLKTPDNDNVYKTYTDMLNDILLLDDRIIVDTEIGKYYSTKPRVEVTITYKKKFTTKFQEKAVKNSKIYKRLMGEIENVQEET